MPNPTVPAAATGLPTQPTATPSLLRRPYIATSVFNALETTRALNAVQEALNTILAAPVTGGVHV